jgi:hypothetical protein
MDWKIKLGLVKGKYYPMGKYLLMDIEVLSRLEHDTGGWY